MLKVTIGFAVGFVLATTLYINAFNPVKYWEVTKSIAAWSAIRGCSLSDRTSRECEEFAVGIYKELDSIGTQIDLLLNGTKED